MSRNAKAHGGLISQPSRFPAGLSPSPLDSPRPQSQSSKVHWNKQQCPSHPSTKPSPRQVVNSTTTTVILFPKTKFKHIIFSFQMSSSSTPRRTPPRCCAQIRTREGVQCLGDRRPGTLTCSTHKQLNAFIERLLMRESSQTIEEWMAPFRFEGEELSDDPDADYVPSDSDTEEEDDEVYISGDELPKGPNYRYMRHARDFIRAIRATSRTASSSRGSGRRRTTRNPRVRLPTVPSEGTEDEIELGPLPPLPLSPEPSASASAAAFQPMSPPESLRDPSPPRDASSGNGRARTTKNARVRLPETPSKSTIKLNPSATLPISPVSSPTSLRPSLSAQPHRSTFDHFSTFDTRSMSTSPSLPPTHRRYTTPIKENAAGRFLRTLRQRESMSPSSGQLEDE
ncbi:hypothetical protein BKA81DRAFT_383373 [Phyllosticta paracitricarpa]